MDGIDVDVFDGGIVTMARGSFVGTEIGNTEGRAVKGRVDPNGILVGDTTGALDGAFGNLVGDFNGTLD